LTSKSRIDAFKARLRANVPTIGTWLKTPSHIVADVLSRTELDVLCLDAEHAPFDRLQLDACALTARLHDMPVLFRVPAAAPHYILNALDIGATGILAPHILNAADAEALVTASHFGPGGRGYAGSTRAAGYTGRSMASHMALSRESTLVVAQIEDAEAVEEIDGIAATKGIDCLFIGRADLAVSLGCQNAADPKVMTAAERVARAGKANGLAVGTFVPDLAEVPYWIERGTSLFLLESDQAFLLKGARQLKNVFAEAAGR
jgi:2-keto-3-deoxy-L-rhamnonate aldolase RhmA